jgi:tetrahydromethanopterin S-methyltransferase subunit B
MSEIDRRIRSTRIVVFGLMAGLVFFAVVALAARKVSNIGNPPFTAAVWTLGLFVVGVAVAFPVVERPVLQRIRARTEELRHASDPAALILNEYVGLTIMRAGLLEAPGFFGAIVYIVSGSVLGLTVTALALAFLGLLLLSREALDELARRAVRGVLQ